MAERTASSPYVCGWTLDDECCAKLATAFAENAVMAQACVDQAGEILYALSGRQFGVCEVTARPCRRVCDFTCGTDGHPGRNFGYRWTPVLQGGQWSNISCTTCRDYCFCTEVCEILLPGPVDHITEIRLDGVVLDPSEYRVDNRRRLVRVGERCWPICQDMNLEPTEVDTWEVVYGRGRELPVAGQTALAALACELCKACIGDKDCCLPERVTTIARQGLTMALLDPMEFLSRGRTGIYAVDLWLSAVNPQGRSRHAGVFSPDAPLMRTTSWP